MQKDEVIARRNLLKSANPDIPVTIMVDNTFTYNERYCHMYWNDTIGEITIVRANSNVNAADLTSGRAQIVVEIYDYNEIQCIKAGYTKDLFIKTFKGKGMFTDEQIESIVNKYCPGEERFVEFAVDPTTIVKP